MVTAMTKFLLQVTFKEPYMSEIKVKFGFDPYLKEMKMFLDTVSSSNVLRSFIPADLLKGYETFPRENFLSSNFPVVNTLYIVRGICLTFMFLKVFEEENSTASVIIWPAFHQATILQTDDGRTFLR